MRGSVRRTRTVHFCRKCNREARFFAKLQPTSAPNSFSSASALDPRGCAVPSLASHKNKQKTWLGLKGDQCEQTFYNGGWSQAQLSYGESSSYSDRGDVLFYIITIRTSEHFIPSAFWRCGCAISHVWPSPTCRPSFCMHFSNRRQAG